MAKQMKKSNIIIAAVAAVCVLIVAIVAVVLISRGGNKYEKHMELARQYIDELDYEQAIAELQLAIEIDPNNSEAYLLLADIYVAQEDYENAVAVIETCIERTGVDWSNRLDFIRELQAAKAAGNEETDPEDEEPGGDESQNDGEEEPEEPYTGEVVKTVRVTMTYYPFLYAFRKACTEWRQYEYDSLGNMLKESYFDSEEGDAYNWTEYQYDGTGKLLKKSDAPEWTDYVYDSEGKLVKELTYRTRGEEFTSYEYDNAGNLVERTKYYDDGSMDAWKSYEYNDAGVLVKCIYNSDIPYWEYCYGIAPEDPSGWTMYEYDSIGNLTKTTDYDFTGQNPEDPSGWTMYEYDGIGNLTKTTNYYSTGQKGFGHIYEYDSEGRMIKDSETGFEPSEAPLPWTAYEYDSEGNLIKETRNYYQYYYSDTYDDGVYEYEYTVLP